MANITLTDIVREATEEIRLESEKNGLNPISANDVERSARKVFDKIIDHLAEGDKVYLINFLNLEPKDYDNPKKVKNPQTGEEMVIEPYRTINCKPSKKAKDKISEGFKRKKK